MKKLGLTFALLLVLTGFLLASADYNIADSRIDPLSVITQVASDRVEPLLVITHIASDRVEPLVIIRSV